MLTAKITVDKVAIITETVALTWYEGLIDVVTISIGELVAFIAAAHATIVVVVKIVITSITVQISTDISQRACVYYLTVTTGIVKTIVKGGISSTRDELCSGMTIAAVASVGIGTSAQEVIANWWEDAAEETIAAPIRINIAFIYIDTCDTVEFISQVAYTTIATIIVDTSAINCAISDNSCSRVTFIYIDTCRSRIVVSRHVAWITSAFEAAIKFDACSWSAVSLDGTTSSTFIN